MRRDSSGSAIASQSTSDVPARGVEANNSTGNVPPSDAGYYLPGSRAREVAQEQQAGQQRAPPEKDASDGGLAIVVAADETGPCESNADCTSTRVPTGGCCATLCDARALTTARAAALQDQYKSCSNCPTPLCRPSRFLRVPGCVEGRCKMVSVSTD